MIRHAISSPRSSSSFESTSRSLNGTTCVWPRRYCGMPSDIGSDAGCFAPAHQVGVRHDGEHHRVVVTVVRAFDLHDVVATGRGARDADRAHRRFGARVREAHLLEVEAPAQLLGEQHGVFGRHREVRAGVGSRARSPRRSSGARGRRPSSRSRRACRRTRGRRRPRRRRRGLRAGRSGTDRRPGTTSRRRAASTSTRARTARATPGSSRSGGRARSRRSRGRRR